MCLQDKKKKLKSPPSLKVAIDSPHHACRYILQGVIAFSVAIYGCMSARDLQEVSINGRFPKKEKASRGRHGWCVNKSNN